VERVNDDDDDFVDVKREKEGKLISDDAVHSINYS